MSEEIEKRTVKTRSAAVTAELFGSGDANIRAVEKAFGVTVSASSGPDGDGSHQPLGVHRRDGFVAAGPDQVLVPGVSRINRGADRRLPAGLRKGVVWQGIS